MSLLFRTITQLSHSRYALSLLSGALLGLSFPSYPSIHLEVLAWIALVPLLISLRSVEKAGELFRRVYLSMLLFCLISLWWVSLATLPGGVLTIIAQAFFLTIPFLAFYAVKKMAGYHYALFSLPFIWVAWEWAYMQQDLSLGWLTLGNSQANLNRMIQYADLVGVWGISFWLVWFNVFVVFALSGRRGTTLRSVIVMVVMIVTPLIYASVVMRDRFVMENKSMLRITLVQPNINPHEKWAQYNSVEIMERYYRMTGRAVRENRPELVIWPETAIPFSILDTPYAVDQQLLRVALRKWDTALLTGFIDVVHELDQPSESFNASMLLEADNDAVPQIYRKMRLVPFAERVPYVDYVPWLDNLTFSLAGIRGWGKGRDAVVMELTSPRNGKILLANIICYESIFPSLVTEFVRKGARLLTLVTNDGWYGTSYGPYQHLAIGRMRCIENRRAMARCANTGLTVVIDKYGRTIAEVPWWHEELLTADVPLESHLTFYTSYPDLLPKVASVLSLLLFLVAIIKSRRSESLL